MKLTKLNKEIKMKTEEVLSDMSLIQCKVCASMLRLEQPSKNTIKTLKHIVKYVDCIETNALKMVKNCDKYSIDTYLKYDSYGDVFFATTKYGLKVLLNKIKAVWRPLMKRWDLNDMEKVKMFLKYFHYLEEYLHISESAKHKLAEFDIIVKTDNDRYQEKQKVNQKSEQL